MGDNQQRRKASDIFNFRFPKSAHGHPIISTILLLLIVVGSMAHFSEAAVAGSLQLQPPAIQQVAAQEEVFELPEFIKTCSDMEGGFFKKGLGACAKQSQFMQGDTSFTYLHDKLNSPYNSDCTAVFAGIPANYTITYRLSDEVDRPGTGMDQISGVCFLRAIKSH